MNQRLLVAPLLILFSCLIITRQAAAEAPVADTVILNGKVLTLDSNNSIVQAVAILDGKIQAVGSDKQIKKLIGSKTKVIRLAGKMVLPGLIESHCHAIGVARNAMLQPYEELATIAEVQDWIRRRAKLVPPGRWIDVPRTDITRLKERRHPTPAELDAACDTHPVYFNAARKNVLNSRGLKLAGLDGKDSTIPGGKIIRDAQGNILMIAGGDAHLRSLRPQRQFSEAETLAGLQKVHQIYNQVGITSIFERSTNLEGIQLYKTLRDTGQLSVRMSATIRRQFRSGKDLEAFSKKIGVKTGDGDDWVRIGPLKVTVDGGIHWGNTYLSEPYGKKRSDFYVLNDPNYRGDRRYTVDQMHDIFSTGHRLGWQMCCHVTGDAGVASVLSALEQDDNPSLVRQRRFNLIHAYFPSDELARRSAKLGVCVDIQSYLYYKDSDAMAEVYGKDWAERFIGVGTWLKAGVQTAINSDHMIGLDPNKSMNSFNPFLQMYIAVSRKNDKGRVYGRHQKISRIAALRCVTSMPAYITFDEKRKGTLEVGKLADLAVIDKDYLTCDEDDIRNIQVELTMVDGKIVYQRD